MVIREGLMVKTVRGTVGMVQAVREVNGARFYSIQCYYRMAAGWIPTVGRAFVAHSEIAITEAAAIPAVAEITAA